ncbi:MAG: hypothetical protein ACD_75C00603G0003 [uncultured bacterium]|nr:MAG: hypothetical protein ACD_75C00603G0003 [uncultured bacterium]
MTAADQPGAEHQPILDGHLGGQNSLQGHAGLILGQLRQETEVPHIDAQHRNRIPGGIFGDMQERPISAQDNDHVEIGTDGIDGDGYPSLLQPAGQHGCVLVRPLVVLLGDETRLFYIQSFLGAKRG